MSDTKPLIPPHYLADDVTVGELIRWLNSKLVRAFQANDRVIGLHMMELGDGAERAMEEYRNSRDNSPAKQEIVVCHLCGTAMEAGIAIPPAMTDHGEANYSTIPPLVRV